MGMLQNTKPLTECFRLPSAKFGSVCVRRNTGLDRLWSALKAGARSQQWVCLRSGRGCSTTEACLWRQAKVVKAGLRQFGVHTKTKRTLGGTSALGSPYRHSGPMSSRCCR